jgi:ketosteroid isomerase-like protein
MTRPVLGTRPEWLAKLFDAIDAKDAPWFASFISEDGEFIYGSQPPVKGREAIEAYIEQFLDSVESLSHRVSRCWSTPGAVICQGAVTYTRLDGSRVTLPFLNVFDLEAGRIGRYQVFVDPGPLFAPVED